MILDVLTNASRYRDLHPGFLKAFAFLVRPDLKELPVARYEIDGDRVYAMVSQEPGCRKEEAQLETHDKYIDIQLVLAGTDNMGWKPRSSCLRPAGEYDPKTDLRFYADEPDAWIATRGSVFVIFFPEDAHMPLIASGQLHKVVIKVAEVPA